MNLFQRVIASITRRKIPTLVIFIVTFLLGNVLFVSLSIQQSSNKIKEHLLYNLGGKLYLKSDMNDRHSVSSMYEEEYERKMNQYLDIYEKLKKDEHVAYADINFEWNGLTLVDKENYMLNESNQEISSQLHGVSHENLVDIKEKKIQLTQGNTFTASQMNEGEAVILTQDNLYYNDMPIQVGDKLAFTNDEEVFEYTVIGLFSPIGNKYSDIQSEVPLFVVPNQNLVEMMQKNVADSRYKDRLYISSSMIRVKEPKDLEQLVQSATALLGKSGITFVTTQDTVSLLLGPIENFSNISQNVVWFSMVAMAIVVALISFYFIRDRKFEIGIYKSMGLQKSHLIAQFLLEILFVGWIGIACSIASGNLLAQKYSDYIFNTEVEIQQEEMMKYMGIEDENVFLEEYDVEIQVTQILSLVVIGTLSLVVAATLPLLYMVVLDPKKILTT